MSTMDSVFEQQQKYDSHSPPNVARDPLSGLPYYNAIELNIRTAHSPADITRVVDAMKEDIGDKKVGLDAEWNILRDSRGIQNGRTKIQWIQLAYRKREGGIQVLLLWV